MVELGKICRRLDDLPGDVGWGSDRPARWGKWRTNVDCDLSNMRFEGNRLWTSLQLDPPVTAVPSQTPQRPAE